MNTKRCGLAMGLTLVVIVIGMAWSGASAHRDAADASAYTSYASGEFFFPPYPSDSDRMGIGIRAGTLTGMYNPALRAGWYTDWGAVSNPPHPGGMEYARTVFFGVNAGTFSCGTVGNQRIPAWQRSQVAETITGTALMDNLRANPGALWLIGNEPDSIYNGSPIMPELYAELYHEFYTFIKAHDPSARVAIGAIVQPSPLRLEYLDKVLNHYQSLYGVNLPTALWNIHLYAFREVYCEYGAGTPPGVSSNGWSYDWPLWSDADLAAQHLRDMRQWMADRGERDKPLIVTEFGQLMPDDGSRCYGPPLVCITQATSRTTLQNDFNYFLTLTDTLTGYPADGNRLIQMWAWYSLYDSYYGGDLVWPNPPTLTLTLAGEAFAQIASQHFVPYVDLYPVPLITPTLPVGSSGPISVSLVMQIDNRGNTLARSVPVIFSQYDYASGQLLANDLITVSQVFTRYGGLQPQVSHEWLLAPATRYTLTFEIDPAQTIIQARRSPQQMIYVVEVVSLAPSTSTRISAGAMATHTLTLTNTSGTQNTFSFTAVGSLPGWSAQLPQPVTLNAGVSANVVITVSIAPTATNKLTDTLTLTVTAPGLVSANSTLVTGSGCRYNFNSNLIVDSSDISRVRASFGNNNLMYDFNHTGTVDGSDVNRVQASFGSSCAP